LASATIYRAVLPPGERPAKSELIPDDSSFRAVRFDGRGPLYWNVGSFIDNALEADVLVVGNSKVLLGFHDGVLDRLRARTGLRFYNLGFGDSETEVLPLAIIERHDLRPKVVLANADVFFTGRARPFARQIISESRWTATKHDLEVRASVPIRFHLGRVIPHRDLGVSETADWGVKHTEGARHRNERTGAWFMTATTFPNRKVPIEFAPRAPTVVAPTRIDAARRFKATLERRGIALLLIVIPPANLEIAHQIANAIDVSLIYTKVEGLTGIDGAHLNHRSAIRWGDALATRLDASTTWRTAAQRADEGRPPPPRRGPRR